jgi:hypothetical protein
LKTLIKFILLLNCVLCFTQKNIAQVNDAALWENIYLEKNIRPKLLIHLNHEGRITNNITQFHFAYADLGITYKFNKSFHVSLDYVIIEKKLINKNQMEVLSTGHQFYVALTYKKKIKPFVFSFREILQAQYQDVYSSDKGKVPGTYARSKITVKYDLNRFTPYIAGEIYYKLYNPRIYQANRYRCFAGIFYQLNKINELELYYLFEKHFNENNPKTNYVIGVGFSHFFY